MMLRRVAVFNAPFGGGFAVRWASKKAVGSTKNGRDSAPQYLGGGGLSFFLFCRRARLTRLPACSEEVRRRILQARQRAGSSTRDPLPPWGQRALRQGAHREGCMGFRSRVAGSHAPCLGVRARALRVWRASQRQVIRACRRGGCGSRCAARCAEGVWVGVRRTLLASQAPLAELSPKSHFPPKLITAAPVGESAVLAVEASHALQRPKRIIASWPRPRHQRSPC